MSLENLRECARLAATVPAEGAILSDMVRDLEILVRDYWIAAQHIPRLAVPADDKAMVRADAEAILTWAKDRKPGALLAQLPTETDTGGNS